VTETEAPQLAPRARLVHELAEAEHFALAGVAPARACEHADWVRYWIDKGRHGEMHYLAEGLEKRLDPATLLPGCQSVIVLADAYIPANAAPANEESPPSDDPPEAAGQLHDRLPPAGRVTAYGRGRDYHKTIKKRLHRLADTLRERFPERQFKCTCDTAPTLERDHAQRAGLGWAGKHTLLIHPRHGSYFFLGCILTDLPIQTSPEADYPGRLVPPMDHCGTCTRCIEACPTGCIADPDTTGHRTIDASRCISYLTIEHRGPIAPEFHEPMGDWLAGCDICQQVCPYNRATEEAPLNLEGAQEAAPGQKASRPDISQAQKLISPTGLPVHERYQPELPGQLPLAEILDWTEPIYQERLRGSALKRMKLPMWKRNALIAAGNYFIKQDEPELRRRVEQLAADAAEPDLVRITARQVLERLPSDG